jgi:hypothetical protein
MSRMLAAGVFAMLLGLATARPAALAGAAETTPGQDALDRLQLPAEQRQRLLRDDVVSYPVTEYGDRDLAVGLALFVRASPARLVEYLVSGQLLARDALILAHGPMPDASQPAALPAVGFSADERNEAERLLDAGPGTRFNLSPREIEMFRSLRGPPGSVTVEQISERYRALLRDRSLAYQRDGLAGIAPYARAGGALTDPAAELRLAIADADRVPGFGPQLREALTRYPADRPSPATNRLYWVRRRVQRRPHLSLLHQMVFAGPEVAVHVERYFYAGHSYNAAQIITGAFGYGDGTVVFATSHFPTDEVLGVVNRLKRSVGHSQLGDEMRKRLEGVRLAFRAPATSPQNR